MDFRRCGIQKHNTTKMHADVRHNVMLLIYFKRPLTNRNRSNGNGNFTEIKRTKARRNNNNQWRFRSKNNKFRSDTNTT